MIFLHYDSYSGKKYQKNVSEKYTRIKVIILQYALLA